MFRKRMICMLAAVLIAQAGGLLRLKGGSGHV